MAQKNHQPLVDPEDMFAETRMSFGDHIEDLRSHFVRAGLGFLIAMVVCILPPMGPWSVKFITAPLEQQLNIFYDRYYAKRYAEIGSELASRIPPIKMVVKLRKIDAAGDSKILEGTQNLLENIGFERRFDNADEADGIPYLLEIPDPIALSKAITETTRVIRPRSLSTFSVQEAFTVYVKVALLVGFVFASPWVFYQLWSFVAAGLYPHEKKLVNYYLPVSLGLFLIGFFVCEFLALPKAIEALLWFNEWLGFEPDLRLSEWLSFAIIMPLVFGLSFQTPIVMLFLFKIGVADVDSFRSKRRIAIFLMAVFAAVITPSTDIANMLLLWVPMCLLYEVGILLCKMQPKSLSEEMDESELDEMVGV
jgi:sec-independent protein translocase protein TatC